jgi:NAD-dependent DNA ligase
MKPITSFFISSSSSETFNQEFISKFKQRGLSLLETLSEEELISMIQYTNHAYYNSSDALLTDNEFDILKEYTETKYPTTRLEIGAPVLIEKNKVVLPYEMPSMDKIKPDTTALTNWLQDYSGEYVLSCKLDGVSGLYVVENHVAKLYTRGDGRVGQDITHLLSVLKLPVHNGYAIRGEFIIPKQTFETKYKAVFANPRNLVSGIINAKKIDSKTQDLHFITYEVVHPALKPSLQMRTLLELKHEVVRHMVVPSSLTNEMLSEKLLDWRQNYDYEIDGVIVADDKIYPRVSGNPEHAFAFKMVISDQMAECKVVDVLWSPSKNGLLKPRVRIEPVCLCGVTIEYATGFNGKFILDNGIGIGALIQIVRSGDVIPYIKGVTVAAEKAKMPEQSYTWSDTCVDVILENFSEDSTVREKNATGFFTTLEVDGLSSGNIKRLFKAGYNSVAKILKMSKADFETVDGFKDKSAEKISQSIRLKVGGASLFQILVASNKIGKGLGEKKILPILEAFPLILTSCETAERKIEMLKSVKGIGRENAQEFVQNIPVFLGFLEECGLQDKLVAGVSGVLGDVVVGVSEIVGDDKVGHPLYKKKIVMSKIRDKQIIDLLPTYGAVLEDTMKKDVFALVIKSHSETSNKTEFAKKNGIPIFTPEEFKARFLI